MKQLKPFIHIEQGLGLHLARPELAPAVFETIDRQRDYLGEWLPWVEATLHLSDTEAFIRESMEHNTDGTKITTFIVLDEKMAGSLGVVSFNKNNHSCEIGYWLSEDLQGQGIMTKACKTFISHLFRAKAINRIEIKVAVNNHKSLAVPERLGFVREGVLRQGLFFHGQYHDLVVFGLLRQDWKENGAEI